MNGLSPHTARQRVTCVMFSIGLATVSTASAQTLPFGIPDFCASASITSVGSGSWSSPTTWSPSRIPAAGDVVRINSGHIVTYDTGERCGHLVLEFLPHIGNLSRNVVIRSENPNGTRGHTMFVDRVALDLRQVLFKDLGRTTNATPRQ